MLAGEVEENTTVKSIIDLSLELLTLEKEDTLLDVGSGIGTTLLEASKTSSISGLKSIQRIICYHVYY